MGNVLAVTGAAGYLGTGLVRSLVQDRQWDTVIGIDLKRPLGSPGKLVHFSLDIRDSGMTDLLISEKVEHLIHLAFVVSPMRNQDEMRDINVGGMRNVLEAARKARVKHLVVTSSATAYGAWKDNPEWLTEDHPLHGNPGYQYAAEKAEIDLMCREFGKENPDITVTVLRPCIVFGPGVDNYISRMLCLPVLPVVDGENPRMQLVHEEDVVECLRLVLAKKTAGAFNVAGRGVMRWREIVLAAGKIPVYLPSFIAKWLVNIAWRLKVSRIEAPSPLLDFITYPWVVSLEKSKNKLGFESRYSARETLDSFLRYRAGTGS